MSWSAINPMAAYILVKVLHSEAHMIQKTISDEITGGLKIVYRRVSTKNQSDNGYRGQLRTIKARDPNLTLASEHVIDLKENISGYATSEQRMAGTLGRGLRLLKRNPIAVMVVASVSVVRDFGTDCGVI